MNPIREKKSYPAVDCFKFICCLLIIAIHTKPFEQNFWLDGGVGIVTRFAVPYFFVATGFFFFLSINGKEDKRSYLIKYELRMLRLYAVWFVIQTAQNMIRGYVFEPLYYIRHFIWPNNGSILWFLPATMFAVFVVYEMSKILKPKVIFAISIVVWLIGYSLSTAAPLIADRIISADFIAGIQSIVGIQNGLFFGFPYIALSLLFATTHNENHQLRDIIGIVVSFGCLGAESLFVVLKIHPTLTFLWIFALPLTYFTFHLTLNLRLEESPIYVLLRKISTLVYVIHPIVLTIFNDVYSRVGFSDFYNMVLFFGVSAISILAAYIIYRLSQRFKIFGYLM